MPIIELSYFGNMSEDIFSDVYALYISIEKQPKVRKDILEMIANRLLHALARDFYLLKQKSLHQKILKKH